MSQLAKLKGFTDVLKEGEKLKAIWDSDAPHRSDTLKELTQNMTPFKRMLLLVSLRPGMADVIFILIISKPVLF